MLKTQLSKLRACSLGCVPRLRWSELGASKTDKLSNDVLVKAKSTSTGRKDDEYEKCRHIIELIFGPEKSVTTHGLKNDKIHIRKELEENLAQLQLTEEPSKEPLAAAQSAVLTSAGNEIVETAEQKLEKIDETPFIEAVTSKIKGFNPPKLEEKSRQTISYTDAMNRKDFQQTREINVLDSLAKRCLGSPTNKIDDILLTEMRRFGILQTLQRESSPVIEELVLQMDVIKKPDERNDVMNNHLCYQTPSDDKQNPNMSSIPDEKKTDDIHQMLPNRVVTCQENGTKDHSRIQEIHNKNRLHKRYTRGCRKVRKTESEKAKIKNLNIIGYESKANPCNEHRYLTSIHSESNNISQKETDNKINDEATKQYHISMESENPLKDASLEKHMATELFCYERIPCNRFADSTTLTRMSPTDSTVTTAILEEAKQPIDETKEMLCYNEAPTLDQPGYKSSNQADPLEWSDGVIPDPLVTQDKIASHKIDITKTAVESNTHIFDSNEIIIDPYDKKSLSQEKEDDDDDAIRLHSIHRIDSSSYERADEISPISAKGDNEPVYATETSRLVIENKNEIPSELNESTTQIRDGSMNIISPVVNAFLDKETMASDLNKTLPTLDTDSKISLGALLKQVRERNHLETCRQYVTSTIVDPALGTCGKPQPPCPPPAPTCPPPKNPCPPTPKCPPPQPPCPKPCPPKCPDPCPKPCPPKCPDPCAKCANIFSNPSITLPKKNSTTQDLIGLILSLSPQLGLICKYALPVVSSSTQLNKIDSKSEKHSLITQEVVLKLRNLGVALHLPYFQTNIDFIEKYRHSAKYISNYIKYARDCKLWAPIYSWAMEVKDKKKKQTYVKHRKNLQSSNSS